MRQGMWARTAAVAATSATIVAAHASVAAAASAASPAAHTRATAPVAVRVQRPTFALHLAAGSHSSVRSAAGVFSADRYFTGGQAVRVAGTAAIAHTARTGSVSYSIPVPAQGTYQLALTVLRRPTGSLNLVAEGRTVVRALPLRRGSGATQTVASAVRVTDGRLDLRVAAAGGSLAVTSVSVTAIPTAGAGTPVAPPTLPPVTVPPVTVPPVTVPPVTVPPVTVPPVTVPPVTVPPVTVPPVTVPPVTVPPVTVPPVTVPPITVPPITVPPITVPPITVPPITVPPITVPPITVPPVTVPPITVPPITVPPITVPPVTVPPITLPPVVPSPARVTWASGVWPGQTLDTAAGNAFASYRGHALDVATVFTVRDNWDTLRTNTWAIDQWAGFPGRLAIGVPLITEDRTATLADVAAGTHDADFAGFAAGLVAKGRGNSIVRLGWEFDGDWTPWAATDAASYIAAFRHVVGVLRSVAPLVVIDWDGTVGESHVGHNPFTELYPGDDVVDIVGVDAYDTQWHTVSDAPSWQAYRSMVNGLDAWLSFARAHGKQFSVPEWGLDNPGNRDNPFYIQSMHDFFAANAGSLAYESYFNEQAGYIQSSLEGPDQNAASSALYAKLWSQA